jgi:hypothetical protein
VAAFVVGVLALVAFVLWELRSKRPMLDPRLFLVRPFSAGTLSIMMSHVAIFGLFFVALQYLQQILGYSPLLSGVAVLPMVAAFALSPASAHLSERVGAGPVIAGGLALAAAGLSVLATLGVGSSYWHVLGGYGLERRPGDERHRRLAGPGQGGRGLRSQRPLPRTGRRPWSSDLGERAQCELPLRPCGRDAWRGGGGTRPGAGFAGLSTRGRRAARGS